MDKIIKDVKCAKIIPYEEDGRIYLDWYGTGFCDGGRNVTIHIPKMDSGFNELNCNTFEHCDYDWAGGFIKNHKKECFVKNSFVDEEIFFEIYNPDEDEAVNNYDELISLSSDDEKWIEKEAHYYVLRGYKVTDKSYLNKVYYYDLKKEN